MSNTRDEKRIEKARIWADTCKLYARSTTRLYELVLDSRINEETRDAAFVVLQRRKNNVMSTPAWLQGE